MKKRHIKTKCEYCDCSVQYVDSPRFVVAPILGPIGPLCRECFEELNDIFKQKKTTLSFAFEALTKLGWCLITTKLGWILVL